MPEMRSRMSASSSTIRMSAAIVSLLSGRQFIASARGQPSASRPAHRCGVRHRFCAMDGAPCIGRQVMRTRAPRVRGRRPAARLRAPACRRAVRRSSARWRGRGRCPCALGRHVGFEQPRAVLLRQADAIVDDLDDDALVRRAQGALRLALVALGRPCASAAPSIASVAFLTRLVTACVIRRAIERRVTGVGGRSSS